MAWVDAAGGWLDAAVVRTRRLRGAPDGRIDAMQAAERVARLTALSPTYSADALLGWPDGFLGEGPPIRPVATAVRTVHGAARDLAWPSAYRAWNAEVGDVYLAGEANATARARLFPASDRPGPVIVALHGYGAGHLRLEQLVWPIRAWHRRGIDVVLPTLPFHGLRAAPGRRVVPVFPAADPRFTNEGFRQTVHELTALIRWLKDQGHGPVGLAGMSLGGYVAALMATLVADLPFLVLVIPLASIADFARTQGRIGAGPAADAIHAGLESVYRVTSPLTRPSRVSPDRVRIAAARGDRITGVAHAERLGKHFGVEPQIGAGSHIVQVGLRWGEIADFTADRAR